MICVSTWFFIMFLQHMRWMKTQKDFNSFSFEISNEQKLCSANNLQFGKEYLLPFIEILQ